MASLQPSFSSSKTDIEVQTGKEREDSNDSSLPDQQHDTTAPPSPQQDDKSMDGSPRAWLMVLGAFLALANTMGLQSTFGAFQSFYERDLLSTHSPSTIAWIGTLQLALSAGSGIVTGPLFDRGHDKYIFLLAGVFVVLSYMLLSICSVYWQVFLAQGVLGGLSGIVFTPALGLATVNFTRRKALATGVATSGFAFGAVVYPIVFRRLQPRIGFAWTCRVLGFIAIGCLLMSYPLLYYKTVRTAVKARRVFDLSAWKEAPYAVYCCAVWFMYAGYWPAYIFVSSRNPYPTPTALEADANADHLLRLPRPRHLPQRSVLHLRHDERRQHPRTLDCNLPSRQARHHRDLRRRRRHHDHRRLLLGGSRLSRSRHRMGHLLWLRVGHAVRGLRGGDPGSESEPVGHRDEDWHDEWTGKYGYVDECADRGGDTGYVVLWFGNGFEVVSGPADVAGGVFCRVGFAGPVSLVAFTAELRGGVSSAFHTR